MPSHTNTSSEPPSPINKEPLELDKIGFIIGMSASESEVTPDAVNAIARDIQNRIGRRTGSDAVEQRGFRDFFGTSVEIVCMLWHLLSENELVPEKGQLKHLLWTLYFFKVYPKQGPGCAALGGSGGAIDPKTLRKWVWPFSEAIADLHAEVVSIVCLSLITFHLACTFSSWKWSISHHHVLSCRVIVSHLADCF